MNIFNCDQPLWLITGQYQSSDGLHVCISSTANTASQIGEIVEILDQRLSDMVRRN